MQGVGDNARGLRIREGAAMNPAAALASVLDLVRRAGKAVRDRLRTDAVKEQPSHDAALEKLKKLAEKANRTE